MSYPRSTWHQLQTYPFRSCLWRIDTVASFRCNVTLPLETARWSFCEPVSGKITIRQRQAYVKRKQIPLMQGATIWRTAAIGYEVISVPVLICIFVKGGNHPRLQSDEISICIPHMYPWKHKAARRIARLSPPFSSCSRGGTLPTA